MSSPVPDPPVVPKDSTLPLLQVDDLVVDYRPSRHSGFRALQDVSLHIGAGECVGLVGESGSGKSTLGKAILGLTEITAGTITFDGRDITHANRATRRRLASDIQVIFQDPYGSLSPTMTVEQILAEPLAAARTERSQARRVIADMLDRVRLPADALQRYPSEFSGGQRQRIAIARALVRGPRLVVCDEPVSALDLTTQATIVELLIDLQAAGDVSYLFVSHDLGVVRRISHRVSVLRRGQVLEAGPSEVVTAEPEHPYSQRLLLASPVADPTRQARRRQDWLQVRDSA